MNANCQSARREHTTVDRRVFLKATGSGLVAISGCRPAASGKKQPVRLGTTSYAAPIFRRILADLEFSKRTGIQVEVVERPLDVASMNTQMLGAVQSGVSRYDVLDFEDEIAVPYSRAGWLLPLDEIISPEVVADFTPPLAELHKVWNQRDGHTFRVHHNFEPCYWWYRGDWFAARGTNPPTTWDEVAALGEVFSDRASGVWTTEDGLEKNAFLNVYVAWITRQAGGSPYSVNEPLILALKHIHRLMYETSAMNPASLQKSYNQQNTDYIADRVACMRQWPFFYEVCRSNKRWFSGEKVVCGLPPIGPGGASTSTYACGWGYGIPSTANDLEAARELVRFLIAPEVTAKLVEYSSWFLNARTSALEAIGDRGTAKFLRMYTEAGVISARPYHDKYTKAVVRLEDNVSAYLTNQQSLDETMSRLLTSLRRLEPV